MPFPLSFNECEHIGGHCWESEDRILLSNPPQHPQHCKHCGATRTGVAQEGMRYSSPSPRPDDPIKGGAGMIMVQDTTHWVADKDARDRPNAVTGCDVKVTIVLGYGEKISTRPDDANCERCMKFLDAAEEYANTKVYGGD